MSLVSQEFAGYLLDKITRGRIGRCDRFSLFVSATVRLAPFLERPITPPLRFVTQPVGELGGRVVVFVSAGSRIFVRVVAVKTPMPMNTITPTAIQVVGTLSR